jgi:hypothetical protein
LNSSCELSYHYETSSPDDDTTAPVPFHCHSALNWLQRTPFSGQYRGLGLIQTESSSAWLCYRPPTSSPAHPPNLAMRHLTCTFKLFNKCCQADTSALVLLTDDSHGAPLRYMAYCLYSSPGAVSIYMSWPRQYARMICGGAQTLAEAQRMSCGKDGHCLGALATWTGRCGVTVSNGGLGRWDAWLCDRRVTSDIFWTFDRCKWE